MKKWNLEAAFQTLKYKSDCKIVGGQIRIRNGESKKQPRVNDLGLKSWAAIDYLHKVHAFSIIDVYEL